MAELVAVGTWVEIGAVVLTPAERAPNVPEETRRVPLEMRVKGFLAAPAATGERACIVTAAGRRLEGTLRAVNPPYAHGFGAPIAALVGIGREVRARLESDPEEP